MSDLFISYSRKDKEFVHRLHDALKEQGRDVWVDWEDIPPRADWHTEIFSAIEAANSFLFVLSPDSVASQVCGEELGHAIQTNKRLVPIVWRDVDPRVVNSELTKLNWVYMRATDDFANALKLLATAIDTDLDWVNAHTRLLTRSTEWNSKKRDDSLVLRGRDLREAEEWQAKAASKEPKLTAMQSEYILASRKSSTRRQRIIVSGVTLGFIVAILLAVVALFQADAANNARATAVTESDARATEVVVRKTAEAQAISNAATAVAERNISESRRLVAQSNLSRANGLDTSLLLAVQALKIDLNYEARNNLLTILQQTQLKFIFHGQTGSVNSLTFSHDGKILATGSCGQKQAFNPCTAGEIRLWDVTTGKQIGRPLAGHTGSVLTLAFNPDDKILASGSSDTTIRLWDVASGQQIGASLKGHTQSVTSIIFSPDRNTLVSASSDGTAQRWDIASQKQIGGALSGAHQALDDSSWGVAFSPDGKTLVAGNNDNIIRFWNVANGEQIGQSQIAYILGVSSRVFSHDGKMLATGICGKKDPFGPCTESEIRLWDVATGNPIGAPLAGHTGTIWILAFSPNNQMLASGSCTIEDVDGKCAQGEIRLWDVASGKQIGTPLTGLADAVVSLAFSPDGKILASGSCVKRDNANCVEGEIRLWYAINNMQQLIPSTLPVQAIRSLAFTPDSQTLASWSYNNTLRFWDVASGKQNRELLIGLDAVPMASFSLDGNMLALVMNDNTIRLWDVVNGKQIGASLLGHADTVNMVAFSTDGKMLASASSDYAIRLWSVASGKPIGVPLIGHEGSVNSVTFSPDGKMLGSGSDDKTIRLWSVASGKPIGVPLIGHEGSVVSLAFSPDDKMIASGSRDMTFRLWNIATSGQIAKLFTVPADRGYQVALSPEGKMLATGSCANTVSYGSCLDAEIRLWDVASGKQIGSPLRGHTNSVNSLVFSPDGKMLASGSNDNTIRLWSVGVESWQSLACTIVNRNLTRGEWTDYFNQDTSTYDSVYAKKPTCPNLPIEPMPTPTPTPP